MIDDAQWADTQSLRWIDFLARRVADTPALILVAARTGEADEPAELEPMRLEATEVLRPAPLSGAGVEALIAAEFGDWPTDEFSAACSQGHRWQPVPAHGGACATCGRGPPAPMRRPPRSSPRWARSPSPARSARGLRPSGRRPPRLARAIAVLGGAPQLRHAASLAGVSEDHARELCDRLRVAEILAPGHPIDFVHPLVRTAVYGELSEEERSDAHRRAAELISSTGGDARRGRAPPDGVRPERGSVGRDRAPRRRPRGDGRGRPRSAARRYLERALEEPAPEEVELTYELGRARWQGSADRCPRVARFRCRAHRATPSFACRRSRTPPGPTSTPGTSSGPFTAWAALVKSVPADGADARLRPKPHSSA